MDLTENEIIETYAKQYGHCQQNTLFPYEYEFFLYFMWIKM